MIPTFSVVGLIAAKLFHKRHVARKAQAHASRVDVLLAEAVAEHAGTYAVRSYSPHQRRRKIADRVRSRALAEGVALPEDFAERIAKC